MTREETDRLKEIVQHVIVRLDSLWGHHQDGSNLMVNEHELFDIVQNDILNNLRDANQILHGHKVDRRNYTDNCALCGLRHAKGAGCLRCQVMLDKIELEKKGKQS